jgi:WD40 repeat protein
LGAGLVAAFPTGYAEADSDWQPLVAVAPHGRMAAWSTKGGDIRPRLFRRILTAIGVPRHTVVPDGHDIRRVRPTVRRYPSGRIPPLAARRGSDGCGLSNVFFPCGDEGVSGSRHACRSLCTYSADGDHDTRRARRRALCAINQQRLERWNLAQTVRIGCVSVYSESADQLPQAIYPHETLWNLEGDWGWPALTSFSEIGPRSIEIAPDGKRLLLFNHQGEAEVWSLPLSAPSWTIAPGDLVASSRSIKHVPLELHRVDAWYPFCSAIPQNWPTSPDTCVPPEMEVRGRRTPWHGKPNWLCQNLTLFPMPDHAIHSATIVGTGGVVCIGTQRGALYLRLMDDSTNRLPIMAHDGPITDCRVDSTNQFVATVSVDGVLRIWSLSFLDDKSYRYPAAVNCMICFTLRLSTTPDPASMSDGAMP